MVLLCRYRIDCRHSIAIICKNHRIHRQKEGIFSVILFFFMYICRHFAGADNGYLLTDRAFAGADTLATSYALATAIRKIGEYDIIIGGQDDSVISVPKHHPLSITFSETEDIRVLADKTYSIGYTITGASPILLKNLFPHWVESRPDRL